MPPPAEVLTLVALVDRVTRENLELAGRVGLLQAKLQDAEEEIRLLRAPTESEVNRSTPRGNKAGSGAEKVSERPWWKFWRWYQP